MPNKKKDTKICNEELYEEVSRRLNVSVSTVKEIIQHVSSITKLHIVSSRLDTIRYPHLGKFRVNMRHLQAVENRKRNKNEES